MYIKTCINILLISALLFNQVYAQQSVQPISAKGFKSLFVNNQFDSTQPYITQLNPYAVSFVQDYIRKQGKELERMKDWGRSYFNLYDAILTQYGIPKEMKYLSVIESHLQHNLVSWAGAVGPWQLMDYEAKRFGLRTGRIDDRTDYYKSTHVAAKLLKELYAEFGDWLLVVAAYNGGAGRMRNCIKKSGSRDFWKLQYLLPEETRNHVKKFIATHYFFNGNGGLTTLTAEEVKKINDEQISSHQLTAEDSVSTTIIEISGRYNATVIAQYISMSSADFTRLNPLLDKRLKEGVKYNLRLPNDKMIVFNARRNEILQESVNALLQNKN